MRPPCSLIAVTLSLFTFAAAVPARAAELKIFDSLGLLRAVKSVDENGRVLVKVDENEGLQAGIFLIDVDGVAPEIQGEIAGSGLAIFDKVPEGSWRVRIESQLTIKEVTIQ